MPIDWRQYQAAQAPAGAIDWARYQGGIPSGPAQEEVINEQHPQLSMADRTKITTLVDIPVSIAQWLQKKGFETDWRDGEVVLRKPGETEWRKVEKTGWLPNEWADVSTDLADEIASLWAMTKGAALGVGATSGTGPGAVIGGIAGAGGGAAAAEAARRVAARAAGFEQGIGEDIADVAIAGGAGAVGEGLGKALGSGVKAVKGRLASRAATRAAEAGAPLGESMGETAARTAALKRLGKAVPPGIDADSVLKEYQMGQLTEEQVMARLERSLPESFFRPLHKKPVKGYVPTTEGEPVLGPSGKAGQRMANQNTLESYEEGAVRDIRRELDPWGKLPKKFEKSMPGGPKWGKPAEAFETLPPAKFFKTLPEENVRELANMVGIQERGVAADELVRQMSKNWSKVAPKLVDKRYAISQMLESQTRRVGQQEMPALWEAVFRTKKDGGLRRMRFQTHAPVTATPMTEAEIREAVEDLSLDELRTLTTRFRQKLERPQPKAMREAIPTAEEDELISILYHNQKAVFKGGAPYKEMPRGLRWVWDKDNKNWRSLSLDFVHTLRQAGGKTIDFTKPGWESSGPWQSFLKGTGAAVRRTGEALEAPLKGARAVAKKAGEFVGVPGAFSPMVAKLSPYGAAYSMGGTPGMVAMGTYSAGARGLQALGRILERDTGSLVSRLIHRAPPKLLRPLRRILKILDLDGEQAAAAAFYVLLKKVPELEQLVREEIPELEDAVQE